MKCRDASESVTVTGLPVAIRHLNSGKTLPSLPRTLPNRTEAARIEYVCPPDQVPDWCKPIVQAALRLERGRGG